MYVALPELPLERMLSRKLFPYPVDENAQKPVVVFRDVSTTDADPNPLLDQPFGRAPDALSVCGPGGLERRGSDPQ
jgi:hypothetical protein